MNPKKTVTVNIVFRNGETERVMEFRKKYPNLKHKNIYLLGIGSIEEQEKQ